jgi:hypothetical protein
MEAQATIYDVTKAKKVAEEKAAASSKAMTKAQEHERETQLAYIAAAKVMRASVGDSEAVEPAPAPATEPASPAPGNLAKSKSKKSMKDLSPTKSPSKKSVADAESPSKSPTKSPSKKSVADMERAKMEEVATLEAWDKAKDELEQATARWKRDSELSTKSAAQYAELVARMKLYETEDEFKASQAQKLKRAIELDAMMPDDGS